MEHKAGHRGRAARFPRARSDFTERLTQAERSEIESLTNYNIELAQLRLAEGTLLDSRSVHLERHTAEKKPWWAWF